MGFIDTAGKKFAALQQRTGDFMTVQKLNSKLRASARELEKLYAAIGESCCRAHFDGSDDPALEALYEKALLLKEDIAAVSAEADRLNRVIRCTKCNEAVSVTLNYCPKCGTKLEHAAPDAE